MFKKFNRVISLMLLLSFVFMFQVPVMAAPAANNLIPAELDPNFDTGVKSGTSYKVGNVYIGVAEAAATYDETNKCISIKSTASDSTGKWNNLTVRGFTFEKGKSYIIAYDAKVDNASTSGVSCAVEKNGDNNDQYLVSKKNAGATVKNEWTRISRLYSCIQTGSVTVVFRFKSNTETMLIDNLAIYEVNYDETNLLNSNYSFEFAVPTNYNFGNSCTANLYNDGSDGNYCLKIPTGAVTDGKLGKLCRFESIPVTGSAMYELSADVKLTGTDAENVKAYMTAQLASGATATMGESINGDTADLVPVNANEWTKVTRIYPVNVLESPKLHVGIRLEGLPEDGCDVLVDNFVVKKIADATTNMGIGTTTGALVEYENKIAVSVTPEEDKSVWMLIAQYNGSRLDKILSLKKIDITSVGRTIGHTFADVVEKENSVVYVWEVNTMSPLMKKIDFTSAN